MKLRTKILCVFTLLFTVVFMNLMVATTSTVKRVHKDTINSFSTQTFEFKSEEIGNWLKSRISEVQLIALYVKYNNYDIKKTLPYITQLNREIGDKFGSDNTTFAIGYNDGIGWVTDNLSIDISERQYFKDGLSSDYEYLFSEPVKSRADETYITLLHYILRDDSNQVYGFLNAAISLEKLDEFVNQIDFYEGKSWIMDDKGTLYTHCEIENDIIDNLTKEIQISKDTRQITHGEKTIFYTNIPCTKNWYLCTAINTNFMYSETTNLAKKLLEIFAIAIILLILFSRKFSKTVTKPIEQLTASMEKFEKGDLDAIVELKANDEIGILVKSYNSMITQIKQLMEQIVINEKEKRRSELRILQAQINPHFLYNTLDTLQWKAYESGKDDMVLIIQSLSSFFRISLSKGKELIPLSKEIEHIKSYLIIQKTRFEDMLYYNFDIEADTSLYVPKLILQPLVENAIQHGTNQKLTPGYINIKIRQNEDSLLIDISDDGVGIDESKLSEIRSEMATLNPKDCYGLINVCKRIKLEYGDKADMHIESVKGEGTCVKIKLPLIEGENNEPFDNMR